MTYETGRAWDALYGPISFTEYEMELIRLPEMQRLRYVRMCNINSMLVTGASEVTRFEHCLGVLHLAKVWADAHFLSANERRDFVAAALLHDLQTGPFGHSFQYILEDNDLDGRFLHDDIIHGYRSRYHQELLATSSFAGSPFEAHKLFADRWSRIGDLIRGQGPLGPLISGSIDLDNIDNVVRLAYHVGVSSREDAVAAVQLVRDMEPLGKQIRVSLSSVSIIERWQSIRRRLYELLLLDWADFSAKGMLTKALELAVEAQLIESQHWLLTDNELLRHLEEHATGGKQEIKELVRRLRRGDLFSPVFLARSSTTGLYTTLSQVRNKRELEAQLGRRLRRGTGFSSPLFVHFILDNRKTDRSIQVQLREGGDEISIGNDSNSLLVGVFVSAKPSRTNSPAVTNEVVRILEEHGLTDLRDIADPVGSAEPDKKGPQLDLL